jgi:hypothetical protein
MVYRGSWHHLSEATCLLSSIWGLRDSSRKYITHVGESRGEWKLDLACMELAWTLDCSAPFGTGRGAKHPL